MGLMKFLIFNYVSWQVEEIEGFVSEFHRNRYLITSRIVGYRQNQLAGDFVHVLLSDFNEDQVLKFLMQWHKAIESKSEQPIDEIEIKSRATSLWDAIKSNPGINRFLVIPYYLRS